MSFFGLGKTVYDVHYKDADGENVESFPTYDKAMVRKKELNSKKLYAYIKKR